MQSDTLLKCEGMKILSQYLGPVEAERFITLILRDKPFNYTEWRRDLFKDVPLKTFLNDAAEFREKKRQGEQRG